MSTDVLFEVSKLKRVVGGRVILTNLSFSARRGDVLFVVGPSGVGKSLLLRCLAYLDPIQDGTVKLGGKTPEQLGVPNWRARVTYVPQTRVQPKGTPSEFYFTAQNFAAQRGRARGDLPALIHELGLEQSVLNQPWTELSGGQSQRVTLAIALALKPEVLLLDEVTSALDHESALRTERVLKDSGATLIWVSHDDSQPGRVGGRILEMPLGIEVTIAQHLASPQGTHPGGSGFADVEDPAAPPPVTEAQHAQQQPQAAQA